MDAALHSVLACPKDHGELLLVENEALYNPRLRLVYPIEEGIPVLLLDEARTVDDAEHESLVARGIAPAPLDPEGNR